MINPDQATEEAKTEDLLVTRCRTLIESKVGWGDSANWTTKEFELLAQKIQATTGVALSLATLKRIWGKIKYTSRPTITTLNALAQFVGYENWRAFDVDQQDKAIPQTTNAPTIPKGSRAPMGIAIAVLVVVAMVFAVSRFRATPFPDSNEFRFSSQKVVTKGIPNSVIFDYDAVAAAPGDTISIQQSWDPHLRSTVSRGEHRHTSIYYYPGFFEAKLVVNGRVVKEHNLLIESDGWLPLIERPGVPVYFSEREGITSEGFGLSINQIESKNVPLQPDVPWVSYYFVRDFGDLKCDNFSLETSLKSDYNEGSGICQFADLIILYQGFAIQVPLSIKGCVSNLNLGSVDRGQAELINLGCDFKDWTTVRCVVKGGKGISQVNGKTAFPFTTPGDKKIVGLIYRFQETGRVKNVKLMNGTGNLVFEKSW